MAETYIEIMLQSLKKKEQVLNKIIQLNGEQKMSLEDDEIGPEKFDETVEEKAKLIEQLEQLDSGFEKLFARVREELNGNKEKYADIIKHMQTCIKNITDKSIEIQMQEARNKTIMEAKFAKVRKQARQVRVGASAATKYYQSMSKLGVVDPQFMDNKN